MDLSVELRGIFHASDSPSAAGHASQHRSFPRTLAYTLVRGGAYLHEPSRFLQKQEPPSDPQTNTSTKARSKP